MRATFVLICAVGLLLVASPAPAGHAKLHGNNFYANCRFSHTNNDDPIVYPGHPGRSHPHTFFGNASTNAGSTLASLRMARTHASRTRTEPPTGCRRSSRGTARSGPEGTFYFNLRGYDEMSAFPAGLKMVAGNSHAFSPQSTNVVYWACAISESARSAPLERPPASCANVS